MRNAKLLVCSIGSLFLLAGGSYAQEIGYGGNIIPGMTVKVDGVDEPVYRVGGGVKPPRAVVHPSAEFSDEARKNGTTGTVLLTVVVTSKGDVTQIRISKSLGSGLDEKAIEAVRQWKFKPATKDGQPVSVQVSMEMAFR
jgi:periplasmic protein TonB